MNEGIIGTFLAFVVVILICLGLAGCPQYGVYQQRLAGEADLAKAEFTKRIAVTTAQAKLDAAKLEAQTDVVRAEGIANANKIVADSLGGPEGYLRWKYIEMLEHSEKSGHDVIYVPTEAGLPILEAGKRKQP
jgi:regulator of protease activity HflC (stomatin/prohibitin superfamily)